MSKDIKNLAIAVLLSTLVLLGWQFFYEAPRKVKVEQIQQVVRENKVVQKELQVLKAKQAVDDEFRSNNEPVGTIAINTEKLTGSISLKGLRFDDLELKSYKKDLSSDSPLVRLFSSNDLETYFAEFGWIKDATDQSFTVPDKNSIWKCNSVELSLNSPISCDWQSNTGVYYTIEIAVDDNYLFTINQIVENRTSESISIANYGRIYKARADLKQFAIVHEGAIGVFSDVLKEVTYEDLSKERQEIFSNTPGSWAGFTNKYWLSALIPDPKFTSKTHFLATSGENQQDVFNVNYISQDVTLKSGEKIKNVNNLFAGAKEEELLENYAKDNNFILFDRAIDFGVLYFFTKPLLGVISYFYSLLGNFGLAIILVTLVLKLLMYPLSYKSFISMNRMKELQPKIEQLKQRYGEDKVKFNQEIMELYKREKVSPAAGCLPMLIQIPIFFALYKVIFIALEMRHAPFYGWIKDLSVQDPTSLWNLFGLMPWPQLGMIDIGLWPLIMAATMFVQQKLSPAPTDPIQATVMKFMPVMLVFMLYSLPSGLMIYWACSNLLSILQQYMIGKTVAKK
jgi:YidC/Oxa1 family membrane protein insertase